MTKEFPVHTFGAGWVSCLGEESMDIILGYIRPGTGVTSSIQGDLALCKVFMSLTMPFDGRVSANRVSWTLDFRTCVCHKPHGKCSCKSLRGSGRFTLPSQVFLQPGLGSRLQGCGLPYALNSRPRDLETTPSIPLNNPYSSPLNNPLYSPV